MDKKRCDLNYLIYPHTDHSTTDWLLPPSTGFMNGCRRVKAKDNTPIRSTYKTDEFLESLKAKDAMPIQMSLSDFPDSKQFSLTDNLQLLKHKAIYSADYDDPVKYKDVLNLSSKETLYGKQFNTGWPNNKQNWLKNGEQYKSLVQNSYQKKQNSEQFLSQCNYTTLRLSPLKKENASISSTASTESFFSTEKSQQSQSIIQKKQEVLTNLNSVGTPFTQGLTQSPNDEFYNLKQQLNYEKETRLNCEKTAQLHCDQVTAHLNSEVPLLDYNIQNQKTTRQKKSNCSPPLKFTPLDNTVVTSQNMSYEELCLFRTRICPKKAKDDSCALEECCPFSHCLSWHRRNPYFTDYRPTLCPNVVFTIGANKKMRVRNHCRRGRLCMHSHTKEEQMYHPLVYKTQLCRDWPSCTKHFCPFAHGKSELRSSEKVPVVEGNEMSYNFPVQGRYDLKKKGSEALLYDKEKRMCTEDIFFNDEFDASTKPTLKNASIMRFKSTASSSSSAWYPRKSDEDAYDLTHEKNKMILPVWSKHGRLNEKQADYCIVNNEQKSLTRGTKAYEARDINLSDKNKLLSPKKFFFLNNDAVDFCPLLNRPVSAKQPQQDFSILNENSPVLSENFDKSPRYLTKNAQRCTAMKSWDSDLYTKTKVFLGREGSKNCVVKEHVTKGCIFNRKTEDKQFQTCEPLIESSVADAEAVIGIPISSSMHCMDELNARSRNGDTSSLLSKPEKASLLEIPSTSSSMKQSLITTELINLIATNMIIALDASQQQEKQRSNFMSSQSEKEENQQQSQQSHQQSQQHSQQHSQQQSQRQSQLQLKQPQRLPQDLYYLHNQIPNDGVPHGSVDDQLHNYLCNVKKVTTQQDLVKLNMIENNVTNALLSTKCDYGYKKNYKAELTETDQTSKELFCKNKNEINLSYSAMNCLSLNLPEVFSSQDRRRHDYTLLKKSNSLCAEKKSLHCLQHQHNYVGDDQQRWNSLSEQNAVALESTQFQNGSSTVFVHKQFQSDENDNDVDDFLLLEKKKEEMIQDVAMQQRIESIITSPEQHQNVIIFSQQQQQFSPCQQRNYMQYNSNCYMKQTDFSSENFLQQETSLKKKETSTTEESNKQKNSEIIKSPPTLYEFNDTISHSRGLSRLKVSVPPSSPPSSYFFSVNKENIETRTEFNLLQKKEKSFKARDEQAQQLDTPQQSPLYINKEYDMSDEVLYRSNDCLQFKSPKCVTESMTTVESLYSRTATPEDEQQQSLWVDSYLTEPSNNYFYNQFLQTLMTSSPWNLS